MNITLAVECMWHCIKTHAPDLIFLLLALNGFLSAIVKVTPTLPANHPLLNIIKIIGRLTQDQTKNEEVRGKMNDNGK